MIQIKVKRRSSRRRGVDDERGGGEEEALNKQPTISACCVRNSNEWVGVGKVIVITQFLDTRRVVVVVVFVSGVNVILYLTEREWKGRNQNNAVCVYVLVGRVHRGRRAWEVCFFRFAARPYRVESIRIHRIVVLAFVDVVVVVAFPQWISSRMLAYVVLIWFWQLIVLPLAPLSMCQCPVQYIRPTWTFA